MSAELAPMPMCVCLICMCCQLYGAPAAMIYDYFLSFTAFLCNIQANESNPVEGSEVMSGRTSQQHTHTHKHSEQINERVYYIHNRKTQRVEAQWMEEAIDGCQLLCFRRYGQTKFIDIQNSRVPHLNDNTPFLAPTGNG